MKYLTCLLLFFLISCGASEPKFKHKPPVVVYTTIAYCYNWPGNDNRLSLAQKTIKDTFAFISIDSTTQTKQWIRDSFYLVPIKDTAWIAPGKPLLDSTGQMKIVENWYPLTKEYWLHDFGKKWGQ